MTVNAYIQLTYDGTTKRFRVLSQGHRPIRQKRVTVNTTVTGKLDVQSAPVVKRFEYLLKLYAEDPGGSDYGTKDDFQEYFELGVDNIVTLTECDDSLEHDIIFVGSFVPENKTPKLTGPNAVFWAQVEMVAVE